MNEYRKWLEMLNALLTIVGDMRISEAKNWVEVKARAQELLDKPDNVDADSDEVEVDADDLLEPGYGGTD
jgi:hypothetical protein